MSPLRALASAPVTVLLLALSACGGGGDGDPGPTPFPTSSNPSDSIPQAERDAINVVLAGADWHVGQNNFVFGITDKKDNPQGGATARATFFDLRQSGSPKPVFTLDAVQSAPGVGPETKHTHAGGDVHVHGGQDEDRVGYYVAVAFTYAGFWGVSVEATLADGTRGVSNIGFQVSEKPSILGSGARAPKSDNLTKREVSDLHEIDSGDPPNDMHDVKIKDALAAGRPLVVVFSTPAFCTSRFCGPVNEEVEALRDIYKDRVDFVHIEIWKNFDRKELSQATKEWIVRADGGLTEPWVFAVDKDGAIYDRWEGPVARNIMEASVKAIAEGKKYSK
ncbi:MAG: hypothetical protein ACR2HN_12945 [Tepidiformaceae bacterium]